MRQPHDGSPVGLFMNLSWKDRIVGAGWIGLAYLLARIIHESGHGLHFRLVDRGFRALRVTMRGRKVNLGGRRTDVGVSGGFGASPRTPFPWKGNRVAGAGSGREWMGDREPLCPERAMPGQAEHDAPGR
jgi:hypothetical protein